MARFSDERSPTADAARTQVSSIQYIKYLFSGSYVTVCELLPMLSQTGKYVLSRQVD